MKYKILIYIALNISLSLTAFAKESPDFQINKILNGFAKYSSIVQESPISKNFYIISRFEGKAWKIVNDKYEKETFLDIKNRLRNEDYADYEEGLLDIAFPRNFKEIKKIYVSYTIPKKNNDGNILIISRFSMSNDLKEAILDTEEILFKLEKNTNAHQAGQLEFSPKDNFLYIGIGSVAGIAMGLIKEGDDFSVLSDILGDEDHLGDMDFKVAGTKEGITSLQMDIKITGITFEIMEQALNQAKDGREHILAEMNKAIKSSRKEVSKYTPKIETVKVDKKDIAAVIGKGGATIREIVELSGAKVDVKDTGEVTIAAPDEESRKKAMEMVKNIIAKPEMGKIYKGKVVKIMEFGAFVNFLGKQDGLVHISQLAGKRVAKVSDVVKEGDEVAVKVIGFDRGKVKLSIKEAS